MMHRLPVPLALLALLAGCVDFVDPVALRLAENTRLNVTLSLSDSRTPLCGQGGLVPSPGADRVTLCVDAALYVGANRFGERHQVLTDTLWVLGSPVLPTAAEGGTLRYQHRVDVPMAQLATTELALVFPRVQEAPLPVGGIRWYAVSRVGPDSIARAPGEDLVLRLRLPQAEANPRPGYRFWSMAVAGTPTSVVYQAYGIPQETYRVPASTLAQLGGTVFSAGLRWTQTLSSGSESAQLYVQLTQELAWRVVTTPQAAALSVGAEPALAGP